MYFFSRRVEEVPVEICELQRKGEGENWKEKKEDG
jgi:hypothetical protein